MADFDGSVLWVDAEVGYLAYQVSSLAVKNDIELRIQRLGKSLNVLPIRLKVLEGTIRHVSVERIIISALEGVPEKSRTVRSQRLERDVFAGYADVIRERTRRFWHHISNRFVGRHLRAGFAIADLMKSEISNSSAENERMPRGLAR